MDLAEYGILVNVVAPGCTLTEMNVIDGVDETATDYFQKWYVEQRKIPLARTAPRMKLPMPFCSSAARSVRTSPVTRWLLTVD